MNYTILVMGAAYGTQNASTAFLFAKALIKTKNILYSVFFYCDGVLNANKMISPASDEFNLVSAWQELNTIYKVKLYVCNSAALRRGILKMQNKSELSFKNGNLAACFELSGLLELGRSIKICDRIVQF